MIPNLLQKENVFLFMQLRGQAESGADLEKYLWGGERGAGIFEWCQHMADVYILNLISYHSLMRNSRQDNNIIYTQVFLLVELYT